MSYDISKNASLAIADVTFMVLGNFYSASMPLSFINVYAGTFNLKIAK